MIWSAVRIYSIFLTEVLKSINEDGVNVVKALAWNFAEDNMNEFDSCTGQYSMQKVGRMDGSLRRRYKTTNFDFVDFFHRHFTLG